MVSCDIQVLLKHCIIKLYIFLKMSFHPVVLIMCNDVRKAFKVEPCTVYLYFFHLVFNFPYLGKVTNGKNKSKKAPIISTVCY